MTSVNEIAVERRFHLALPSFWKIALATFVLFVGGGLLAPGSTAPGALLSILPFIAILAVGSIGQQIVIQQRGLDLSVAGAMSLAAVLVTNLASTNAGPIQAIGAVAAALIVGMVAGGLNGLAVALLRVPSLVTTIGINAVLLGTALMISGGTPRAAPPPLSRFALETTLGIPNTVLMMAVIAAIVTFAINKTGIGRRFVATGLNPAAARVVGVKVERYRIGTYVFAGLCYAIAGVMLAGFLNVPSLLAGNPYLLSTVAAVVVGGSPLTGGRGSVLATVIGAVFLTYLGQLVLSMGFDRSTQDIVQAVIMIAGVGLPRLSRAGRRY